MDDDRHREIGLPGTLYQNKGEKPLFKAAERINHPLHYGGEDNPYEAIKVIEAWNLGFALGNAVKYICRADRKGNKLEDLEKAKWYLEREIANTKYGTSSR